MPQPPATAHSRGVQSLVPPPIFMPYSSISVRYRENSPIRVRGTVSGRHYVFSNSRPVQLVDARDAASLLSTRFFRRA